MLKDDVIGLIGRALNPEEYDPRFKKPDRVSDAPLKTPVVQGVDMIPVQPLSLAELEGFPFLTTMSDRTAAGGQLVGIGAEQLAYPVDLTGGQDFMRDYIRNPNLWASGETVVPKMVKAARELEAEYGRSPVFMPWSMTPTGSDFAGMTGKTMFSYASQNMPKTFKKEVDSYMKLYVPNWKGIDNPESGAQFDALPDSTRKLVQRDMDTKFRNVGGVTLPQTRIAIADQSQLLQPDMGFKNVGLIDTSVDAMAGAGNPTYPSALAGEYMGTLNTNVTAQDLNPNRYARAVKADGTFEDGPQGKDFLNTKTRPRRSMEVNYYGGLFDEQLLRSLEDRGFDVNKKQGGFANIGVLPAVAGAGLTAASLLQSEDAEAGIIPKLSQATQRGNTLSTAKASQDYLKKMGGQGKSIDYGAGLGTNAQQLGVTDTFEPFPREGFNPTYQLSGDIPANSYGQLISTNVLNVIPPEARKSAVQNIGEILEPNGMAVVQTRSASAVNELKKSKTAVPQDEPASYLTKDGTYQKGFTRDELVEYTQNILGDGFEVSKIPAKDMPNGSGVLIRKLPTLAAMGVGASLLFPSEDAEAILPRHLRYGIPSEMKSIALDAMADVPRKTKTSYTGWKKALNKAGVKDDELKQMGFYQEFGHRQKAQDISRQEVEDFLSEKQYNIREIVRKNRDVKATIDVDPFDRGYEVFSPDGGVFHGRYDTIEEAEDAADKLSYRADDTMHKSSQLAPDLSTNYREIELLDGPDADRLDAVNKEIEEAKRKVADVMGVGPAEIYAQHLVKGPNRDAILEERARLMNRVYELEADRKNLPAPFLATAHWDEDANVLAHIRAADRELNDGSQTLMVEEIQSDLHQRGQTIGYAKEGEAKKLFAKRDEVVDKINALDSFDIYTWGPQNVPQLMQRLDDATNGVSNENALDVLEELELARNEDYRNFSGRDWNDHKYELEQEEQRLWKAATKKETSAPDFPFKSDDKSSWYDLSFRRALLEAVDGNYDSISFTTADQQIARWRDDDGLRNFYAKTLPNHINKWAKKYGVQLQKKQLDVTQDDYRVHVYDDDTYFVEDEYGNHVQDFDTLREAEAFMADNKLAEEVLTLPITKEMREDINKKGMALFSSPLIGAGVYGTVAAGATGLLPDGDKQQTTNVVYDDRDTRREQSRQNLMDMLADDARQERGDSIKNIAANVAALPSAIGEGVQQSLLDAMSFIPEQFARGGAALSGGDADAAAASVRSVLSPEVEASSARTRMLRDKMGQNIAYNTGNVIDALTPAAQAIYQSKGLVGPSLEELVGSVKSGYENLPEGYLKDNLLPAAGYGALGVLGMLDFYRPKPRALTGELMPTGTEYDVRNPLGLLQMAN